jgi:hypothetical protein
MRIHTLIFLLLLISAHATATAQDSKFFREKLGKPAEVAEVYVHRSGISVRVDYDDVGQACGVVISQSSRQKREVSFRGSWQSLRSFFPRRREEPSLEEPVL